MPRPADVAQLVEHFTRNEGVPGSSPGVGSPQRPCKRRAFFVTGEGPQKSLGPVVGPLLGPLGSNRVRSGPCSLAIRRRTGGSARHTRCAGRSPPLRLGRCEHPTAVSSCRRRDAVRRRVPDDRRGGAARALLRTHDPSRHRRGDAARRPCARRPRQPRRLADPGGGPRSLVVRPWLVTVASRRSSAASIGSPTGRSPRRGRSATTTRPAGAAASPATHSSRPTSSARGRARGEPAAGPSGSASRRSGARAVDDPGAVLARVARRRTRPPGAIDDAASTSGSGTGGCARGSATSPSMPSCRAPSHSGVPNCSPAASGPRLCGAPW